ncbi:hypothetical protein [Botrimarina sp.]|uniref:hypothetical protein n=1 Tax=Botrimarina sp. TaxID=2795802 RepID=UPI0032F028AE
MNEAPASASAGRRPARVRFVLPVVALGGFALVGCGAGESSGPSELDRMAQQLEQKVADERVAAEQQAVVATADEVQSLRAEADRLANEPPSPITDEDYVRGSHLKRQDMLQTPIRAGIRAEQDLKSFSVEHALNLFMASEGRYPKDHEEFMEKIVEFNNIQLEELKDPYEPWYDGESHTLMKRVTPEHIEAAKAQAESAEAALQDG